MMAFDGIKVFSATKQKERDELGDRATEWLAANRERFEVVDTVVRQSSDSAYHCLTLLLFYKNK